MVVQFRSAATVRKCLIVVTVYDVNTITWCPKSQHLIGMNTSDHDLQHNNLRIYRRASCASMEANKSDCLYKGVCNQNPNSLIICRFTFNVQPCRRY